MSSISTISLGRGTAHTPQPFIGALSPGSTDDSTYILRSVTRAAVNPSSVSHSGIPQPRQNVSVSERLFDALAAFKQKTATLGAAHFDGHARAKLFRQLDSILDAENWDHSDAITTDASFTTLLRLMLFLGGRMPGLGVTGTGNFIATWTEGGCRLTMECNPQDRIRYVIVEDVDGNRDKAAVETTISRLPDLLRAFDGPKRWFPNAVH